MHTAYHLGSLQHDKEKNMLNIFIHKIPRKLPVEIEQAITVLKKTKSKEACLKKAYSILNTKFTGKLFFFITHFPSFFLINLDTIWNRKKVLNCNVMNYLLRLLLIKSGKFKEKDLKNKWTMIKYISPHQYLQVNLGKKKVFIDLWGSSYNTPFGQVST